MKSRSAPRIWPVLLAAGLGLAILLTLGVWQVKRLAWKEALLDRMEQGMAADAMPFDEALAREVAGENMQFRKVKLTGRFAARDPLRLLTVVNGGPGLQLAHGFEQPGGSPVLVNRGALPDGAAIPPPPAGEMEITGLLHWHGEGRGRFDVDNDPAGNLWYWWDVVAMTAQFGATHLDPNYAVVDLLPGSPGTEGLLVVPPKSTLRNNHLGYAITWFGLAAALLAVTGFFLWQRANKADA